MMTAAARKPLKHKPTCNMFILTLTRIAVACASLMVFTLSSLAHSAEQAKTTSAAPVTDDSLGRLFFTPERRQSLDRQRELNQQQTKDIPEDPRLTINGVVTRSSGKRTVWVNGVSLNENEMQNGLAVSTNRNTPGKVIVQAADAAPAPAKVGDTINRNSGEASPLIGDGTITVRPASTTKLNAAPAVAGK